MKTQLIELPTNDVDGCTALSVSASDIMAVGRTPTNEGSKIFLCNGMVFSTKLSYDRVTAWWDAELSRNIFDDDRDPWADTHGEGDTFDG